MRFSLATLLLLVMLAASLMAVWFWRDAWYLDLRPNASDAAMSTLSPDAGQTCLSPDRTRNISSTLDGRFFINEQRAGGKLLNFLPQKEHTPFSKGFFATDDSILISGYNIPTSVYRRRFPEWWWGHLYRPEVWTSIVLGIALVVRAWRSRRRGVVHS